MVESTAAEALTTAVTVAKHRLSGSSGGTFLINEFGQVLVPTADGKGKRLLTGEWTGCLQFHDSLCDDEIFDLCSPNRLECGDEWDRPYVGCQYNLKKWNVIYFYRYTSEGGASEEPTVQDQGLIHCLRQVRPNGPVRFIVNPYGVVLTKTPVGPGQNQDLWIPRYVGQIDKRKWFSKEE